MLCGSCTDSTAGGWGVMLSQRTETVWHALRLQDSDTLQLRRLLSLSHSYSFPVPETPPNGTQSSHYSNSRTPHLFPTRVDLYRWARPLFWKLSEQLEKCKRKETQKRTKNGWKTQGFLSALHHKRIFWMAAIWETASSESKCKFVAKI